MAGVRSVSRGGVKVAGYAKTIEDDFEDEISVECEFPGEGQIGVEAREGGTVAYFAFSPKRARRLAKALKRAAKVAERAGCEEGCCS